MAIPDQTKILEQLGKILASSQFRNAPMLQKLLVFLIEQTASNQTGKLNVNTIARDVFQRDSGFSNAMDPIVRVTAMRLRKALTIYYADEGRFDDIVVDLRPGSYKPNIVIGRIAPEDSHRSSALELARRYQDVADRNAHEVAIQSIANALNSAPEDADLLSAHADLVLDGWKHGYCDDPGQFDLALADCEKARISEPGNSNVRFMEAFLALELGQLDTVLECGRDLASSANDEETIGRGLWLIAVASEPHDFITTADWNVFDQHDHPGWIQHARFMVSYECGEYETALSAAMDFGMPGFFWGPLERTAALGQLGLEKAARTELKRMCGLNPQFGDNPARFLSSYIPRRHVMEHVLEGLEKAGLSKIAH